MGDGTKENPYTREDVLRLIKEHGGKAWGLDLSMNVFEKGIDLSGLDLNGINFRRKSSIQKTGRQIIFGGGVDLIGAHFKGTKLQEADFGGTNLIGANFDDAVLCYAHLDGTMLSHASLRGANLQGAHLERAILNGTDLRDANLEGTNLEGAELNGSHLSCAYLYGFKISSDTTFISVDWGNYILGDEKNLKFEWAVETYQRLKVWYTTHGILDIAGEFFYREMESKRKSVKFRLKSSDIHHLWLVFFRFICGYGERPWRVIVWAASVISILALIYFAIGSVWDWSAFFKSLYFSAVSFTALGYGSWVSEPVGWIKTIGALESFIGVFTMALFLVTFTRKMTR